MAVADEALPSQPATQPARKPTLAQATFDPDFLPAMPGGTVDLSRFEKGNPLLPGRYRADIALNGRLIGRDDVVLQTDVATGETRICFNRAQLDKLGVNLSGLDAALLAELAAPNACVDLQRVIPDAKAAFDSGELRLDVNIPQIALRRTAREYVDPLLWDSGVTAGMLGYTANVYRNVVRGVSTDSVSLGLNAGLNVGDWYFRHNGSLSWTEGASRQYNVLNTYVQRDITPIKGRLTLGDANTSGDVFDTISFRGAQLASDDRMLPESQRGYAPVIHGTAETNARVTIRQNGSVLYDVSVPPGPFEIDDLYQTGYGGDLEVTVKEADGRERTFKVPYASVAQLLRPGAIRYNVMAGTVRNAPLSYTPSVLQGTLQLGLSNTLSAYGGVLGNNDYASALIGGAFSTPLGAFALDISGARTAVAGQSMNGTSVRATYSKLFTETNSNISVAAYRFSSRGFLDFNSALYFSDNVRRGLVGRDAANVWRPRNRLSLLANQSLGDPWGEFYLSGFTQNYWDRSGSDTQFQAGYSNRIGIANYSLSVNRARTLDSQIDTQYMLGVSMPLGREAKAPQLNFNMMHDGAGHNSGQTSVTGVAGEDNEFSYSAMLARSQDNTTAGNLAGQYRSPFATLRASYGKGSNYYGGSMGMSGSLVAHPGGITATPYVADTFAVVEAPAAAGVKILNYPGLKLDPRGFGVVPYLTPYRRNEVVLDPQGLPADVELQMTSQQVAPRAGAVVMLKYPTVSGRAVLIKSQQPDGEALPLGATVSDEHGDNVGTVSQGSLIYARISNPQARLTVTWGEGNEQRCRIDVALPEPEAGVAPSAFERLQASCQAQLIAAGHAQQEAKPAK
ncbi:fimbria/pilus outer membrane usher protein [Andreprevotia chitinilytica]|uniref:fimbria/pilus outer membrane usher protein n=1 Tax=Andreprevotia chitinilytica TaxID=396808 RepID=UPI00147019C3|nr:fimbria/pilus outer membrane usher protein [Andreprevotia chitinilytica]